MSIIVDIILPVFGLVFLGYCMVRFGIFDNRVIDGLARFVFALSLPILLFQMLAEVELPEEIPWSFVIAYYLATALTFAAGTLVARFTVGSAMEMRAIFGLTASFSNGVLLGLPVVIRTFGPEASLPHLILIIFHGPILLTTTTIMTEAGRSTANSWRNWVVSVGRGLVANPVLIGIAAGVTFNLTDLAIPAAARSITDSLSQTALPCAAFAMGGTMARYRIVGNLGPSAGLIAVKLLLHPILVWFTVFVVFDIDGLFAIVALVLASMPAGVNCYVFAERYNAGTMPVATSVVAGTALSILTLTVLLAWLTMNAGVVGA